MEQFKYHPLIDCDSEGMEKVPMFFSYDRRSVSQNHNHYLEEIVPHHYRHISEVACTPRTANNYVIHCPVCGTTMDKISNPIDDHKLSLYVCSKCRPASNL